MAVAQFLTDAQATLEAFDRSIILPTTLVHQAYVPDRRGDAERLPTSSLMRN